MQFSVFKTAADFAAAANPPVGHYLRWVQANADGTVTEYLKDSAGAIREIAQRISDVPFGLTAQDEDNVYYAALDDVSDSVELYKSALNLHSVEIDIVSSNASFTGDIVIIPAVNGVDGDPIVVPVTAAIATVALTIAVSKGTLVLRRDHAGINDTLKDGASIVSARVYGVRYRAGGVL